MKLSLPAFVRKSLQTKFLLLLLLLLFILAFFISGVFLVYENNNQKSLISAQAKAFSNLSVRPLGNAYTTYFDSGSAKFKEITNNILSLDSNISAIELIDVNGNVLYSSKSGSLKPVDKKILQAVNNSSSTYLQSGGELSEIIEPFYDDFGAHSLSVRYFVSFDSLNKDVASTIPLALGVIFMVAIISGLIIIFMVNKTIISPTKEIVDVASDISSGKLDTRINIKSGDELETLALAVNTMASSLQKNIESLKDLDRLKDEFIIIASHNLRTPITVIKGYLTQLNNNTDVKKVFKKELESMIISVSNLEGLIEELLNIVSLETQKKISQGSKINLSELVAEVLALQSKVALTKKIALHFVSQKENYFIEGDVTKLKIVFNNLIENALKFNKEQGSVTIKIEEKGQDIISSIADNGIGISDKEIPLVFNKFHRATDILQYNYQGLGLGLYLARVIVEAHKGKIWFHSKEKEGSTFFVSLPKAVPERG